MASLAAFGLLAACGSTSQYERNQRAMDEQMAAGNALRDEPPPALESTFDASGNRNDASNAH